MTETSEQDRQRDEAGRKPSGACPDPSKDASCWRRRSPCSRRFCPLRRIWPWYGWETYSLQGKARSRRSMRPKCTKLRSFSLWHFSRSCSFALLRSSSRILPI